MLFPASFSTVLSPYGKDILKSNKSQLAKEFKRHPHLHSFEQLISPKWANRFIEILDQEFLPHLTPLIRRIPEDSLTQVSQSGTELLPKSLKVKTAYFYRKNSAAYKAGVRTGLFQMLSSHSLLEFMEKVTGYTLEPQNAFQLNCYEAGYYVGPHTDHHPEASCLRDGYIDIHITLSNRWVDQQFFIYEKNGHLAQVVDVARNGYVAVAELPFWHQLTPLIPIAGGEKKARRWLILSSYYILGRTR